jgi:GTPase
MAGVDGRDPRDDYATLLNELKLYDKSLLEKPRLIVANKMDLEGATANLTKFRRKYKGELIEISCVSGAGLDELKEVLHKRIRGRRSASRRPTGSSR